MERLTTGDFIDRLPLSGVARVPDGLSPYARKRVPAQPCRVHDGHGFQLLAAQRAHARGASARFESWRCRPSPTLDGTGFV